MGGSLVVRSMTSSSNIIIHNPHAQIWLQEQDELIKRLENQEVDVSADGRFDSPGFSAKYATYSVHVEQINKILHSVQVQLREASSHVWLKHLPHFLDLFHIHLYDRMS